MTPQFDLDDGKFADLMLYIAGQCKDDEYFGTTKLCKILYYCDFEAYRRFRKPITGATYVKMDRGPLPWGIYRTRRRLRSDGEATVNTVAIGNVYEDRLLPTADNIELGENFDSHERSLIDEMIEKFRPMTGKEVSDHSHHEFGWKAVEIDEPIPYGAAFIARSDDPRYRKWISERAA